MQIYELNFVFNISQHSSTVEWSAVIFQSDWSNFDLDELLTAPIYLHNAETDRFPVQIRVVGLKI